MMQTLLLRSRFIFLAPQAFLHLQVARNHPGYVRWVEPASVLSSADLYSSTNGSILPGPKPAKSDSMRLRQLEKCESSCQHLSICCVLKCLCAASIR